MTFDIDAKPESPQLPLFGRVGAILLAAATSAGHLSGCLPRSCGCVDVVPVSGCDLHRH